MKKTLETKLMIIENFIDHIETSEVQRKKLKAVASQYVEEDHVDEIEQAGFVTPPKFLPLISQLDVKVESNVRNLKAVSVEQGLTVRFTDAHKDKLVDKELIHFDGFEWKFFDSDLDEVRKVAEY